MPAAVCVRHPTAHVISIGTRGSGDAVRRRYLCTPKAAARHTFSVPLSATPAAPAPPRTPVPPCEQHRDEPHHVIRFGQYGGGTPHPRQRYRCSRPVLDEAGRPVLDETGEPVVLRHVFTPAQPRDPGEAAVSRRHSWSTIAVARGLLELSLGASYAQVSRSALRAAYADAERYAELAGSSESLGTPRSNNVWHIAADWCEAFSPVVFGQVEARLRAHATAERARLDALVAAGCPLDRPQVLLLDDVPVRGRSQAANGVPRRDDGFVLLVAAEVAWEPGSADRTAEADRSLKLRLVRAVPRSDVSAWGLLLDELGYAPDFVVADAGTAAACAVARQFDPARTTFVPSRRAKQEHPITGDLEALVAEQVQPLLAARRGAFANLERTNRLLDLVVAREHGAFDDLGAVVRLLREATAGARARR